MRQTIKILVIFQLLYSLSTHSQVITKFTQNNAFNFGEDLTYKLRYSLFLDIGVGEVNLKIENKPKQFNGRDYYHFIGTGTSYKFYDYFLKVRDRYESYVDIETFLPYASVRIINEGRYHYDNYYLYDFKRKFAIDRRGKVKKIKDFSQDIVSACYLARTFNYDNAKVGDVYLLNIYIDDSNYVLGARYCGKETIKTKDGNKYRCIKLKPILIVDRVFKNDDAMSLWITDDSDRVPVKVFSEIAVGSISAELVSYKGLRNALKSK